MTQQESEQESEQKFANGAPVEAHVHGNWELGEVVEYDAPGHRYKVALAAQGAGEDPVWCLEADVQDRITERAPATQE